MGPETPARAQDLGALGLVSKFQAFLAGLGFGVEGLGFWGLGFKV